MPFRRCLSIFLAFLLAFSLSFSCSASDFSGGQTGGGRYTATTDFYSFSGGRTTGGGGRYPSSDDSDDDSDFVGDQTGGGRFSSASDYFDYVSGLDFTTVTSDGLFVYYPYSFQMYDDYLTLFSSTGFSYYYGFCIYSGYAFSPVKNYEKYGVKTNSFTLPAGVYRIYADRTFNYNEYSAYYYVVSELDDGTTSVIDNKKHTSRYFDITFTSTTTLHLNLGSYIVLNEETFYNWSYSVHVECLMLYESVILPDSSTRPVSLMQTINDYNENNPYINSETVNYYIGTTDDNGTVINIYDIDFYDEDTLIFMEPQTGAQFQTTGWIYDYLTRCYTLALNSGTMSVGDYDIDTVKITYGDDVLSIAYYSGDTLAVEDEYAYVLVGQSECAVNGHIYTYETVQEPTCTTVGERKYTCTVCGNEYAEEIPKTDHSYTVSVEQEATCTTNGIELYTCSICGDQHTETVSSLGHDWLATAVTDDTYNLPSGAVCPDCGSTNFTTDLDKDSGIYYCICSDCGAEWVENAEVTYGHTEYTCSRCGETYIESNDPESGLFASIGRFIANGIGWIVDKLKQLIDSFSSINDIFSSFIQTIKEKTGTYPYFLAAVIECLPEDLMTVIWFAVVAAVVLLVWKKWFH